MKIRILGAGPAGLYFAALMKQHDPSHDIVIYERNRRDATWGFGVVFSDRALEFLRADDEALYQYLDPHLENWPDITIVHNDTVIPVAGNGFTSIGRLELLTLLYAYVEKLGVGLQFGTEITQLAQMGEADLYVGASGASSWIRAENEAKFGTTTDWRPNRFIWYGTTKAFNSLTLTFRETDKGVFCAHHYRYRPDRSTFLVEVEEATWHRAGFESMSPEDTVKHCERVFAEDLDGHPIITNNSYWRRFPAIWNACWSFDNVVLIGDALRTAHFSIGSGTRLAMEDSVALFKAFRDAGARDVRVALRRFQEDRLPPMKKIWDAANASLRWYEGMDRLVRDLSPIEFAYDYMTRTGRVSHAEVKRRDPNLAAAYEKLHPEVATPEGDPMSPHGRPKGEYRRAEPEGTPVSPHGRPKGEYRRAQPEGTPVSKLGRLEDLPADYLSKLRSQNTLPLWPSLRAMLPHGRPSRSTKPAHWRYEQIRPDLIRAGELTPIEKAERRVIVLCNPGLGLETMRATPTIYIGLQLILPGETAPNHRHTPSAVRFAVEGQGGFTMVDGEKLPMEKGDLILTPPGLWHEHGHEGKGPVVWLDALDLPLIYGIEASYAVEGKSQAVDKPEGWAGARFGTGGVVPYASLDARRQPYPMLRFPWRQVRQALGEFAGVTPRDEAVRLAYVNPETGRECLPTLGFSAIQLRPGEELCLPRRSASAVCHVVEGCGTAFIGGETFLFSETDTMAVPTHEAVVLSNGSSKSPAYLFMVDDAPLQRKLGIYEVFDSDAS